jgi:hypothetical protein
MNSSERTSPLVSLIAAGDGETVPSGVPYDTLPLESLDSSEVRAWLAENRRYHVYIMPGSGFASEGVPTITVRATVEDYDRVVSAMPR